MVRRTKQEALETRDAILDAASHVFFVKGVAKAGLEEIAEQAGVTRGAVYWHFKNKVALFEALHDTLHQDFMDVILHDLETDHPDPITQLESLCVRMLLDLSQNDRKQRLLSIFMLKCDYSGEMEQVLEKQEQQKAKSRQLFVQYFERARKKGHVHPEFAPQSMCIGLWCYLTGIVREYLRVPDMLDLENQATQLMRQFFQGLHHSPATGTDCSRNPSAAGTGIGL
ncbi:TetR family transcriptional regulator [Magnetospira thiophila]